MAKPFLSAEKDRDGNNRTIAVSGSFLIILYAAFTAITYTPLEVMEFWAGPLKLQIFNFVFLAAFFIYLWAWKKAANNNISHPLVLFFTAVFFIILLFARSEHSIDIMRYIGWARVFTEFGLNPYLFGYNNLTADSYFLAQNLSWLGLPTPYGPFFTYFSLFFAYIGGNNVIFTYILLKSALVALGLAAAFFIYYYYRSPALTLLYAWNPFLLFELVVGGHSESLSIILLIVGLVLFKQAPGLAALARAWLLLLLAAAAKYYAAVVLPVVFLYGFFREKRKGRYLLALAGVTVLLMLALYAPFWASGEMINSTKYYFECVIGRFALCQDVPLSPLAWLLEAGFKISGREVFLPWAFYIARLVFYFIFGALIIRIYHLRNSLKPVDLPRYSALALGLFFLTAANWLYPWYLTLLIALLVLLAAEAKGARQNAYAKLVILNSLFALLMYFLYPARW
jgi:hypothetical protein